MKQINQNKKDNYYIRFKTMFAHLHTQITFKLGTQMKSLAYLYFSRSPRKKWNKNKN